MNQSMNVVICGVSNQGVTRAGEILSKAAFHAGYDVKMSTSTTLEGTNRSIACFVRYGEKVYSPIIKSAQADAIISFDRLETLRYLTYARDGVHVIVNETSTTAPPSGTEGQQYIEDIQEFLSKISENILVVPKGENDSSGLLGKRLLGAFSGVSGIPEEAWLTAMQELNPTGMDKKEAAFRSGVELTERAPGRMNSSVSGGGAEEESKGVRSFEEMLETVKKLPKRTVAIAGASNKAALHAGIECVELGLGTPIFVGDEVKIRETCAAEFPEFPIDEYRIIDEKDDPGVAAASVAIVRNHEADILLKGGVNTPTLMRAVLSSKTGLRKGSLLSDTFVFEYPDEDGTRLVMITDGGVTLQPTIQQKIEILKNAVVVSHALGNPNPKVAILAASETINPNVAATMDAAVLTKMNRTGQITGCTVDGPIALDVAMSRKAAEIKGTKSPVAGNADIIVTHSIDTANALAKSTTYFAGYRLSHVIVGGTAPILIASRSDTADAKLLSIALGSLMAKFFEEQRMHEAEAAS
ncbi:MAG: hypothetical protein CL946_01690 [Ectothiorhodospiraceae bacterium]|nr:hypothetical protein [Ectothiorhodospiraceae bacterium]